MKLNAKALLQNIATLGYTGTKATHETIKKIREEKHTPVISEVAGFLWLVPAFGWFFFAMELLDVLSLHSGSPNLSFKEIYDVLGLFPGCFVYFSLIHFPIGIAILQHLKKQECGRRWQVLWFAGYALDWSLPEHFKQTDLEPAGIVNDGAAPHRD